MNCCPRTMGRRHPNRRGLLGLSGSRSLELSGRSHSGYRKAPAARGTARSAVIVMLLGCCALGLFLLPPLARGDEPLEMRTWTSTVGTQVRAALLDVEGRSARLKYADGSERLVEIDQLCAADQEYVGQWVDGRAAKPRQTWRQFTNRATRQQFEGKILERVNVRGQTRLFVEDRTGLRAWLPQHLFEITDVTDAPKPPEGEPKEDSVEEESDPPDPDPPGDEPQPRPSSVQEVFVTGTGLDPEEARRNAFSAAIEQVVGVLVDAETLVKNDELVRDQVLTFSRGYINQHTEIQRWQEDGVHHVHIWAQVSLEKLGNKLKESPGIATGLIDGGSEADRIRIEMQNEEMARQMFRRATTDFTPDKLLKLGVGDKRDVERTGAGVKLTVHYTATADLEAWKHIRANVKPLLDRICLGSTTAQVAIGVGWQYAAPLPSSGARGAQCEVLVYSDKSSEGNVTYFDAYALPTWMKPEIAGLAARQAAYQIRLALLDQADHVVEEALVPAGTPPLLVDYTGYTDRIRRHRFLSSSIAPLSYSAGRYIETLESPQVFNLTLDQLDRVAKCAAMWTGGPPP
jgi:hypothetical protein